MIEEPELIEELGALDAAISPELGEEEEVEVEIERSGDRSAEGAQEEEQMELVNEAATPPAPDADPSPVLRLIEQTRAEREARHDRVADLFPRPETTEWNVREIAYDRRRRAQVSASEA